MLVSKYGWTFSGPVACCCSNTGRAVALTTMNSQLAVTLLSGRLAARLCTDKQQQLQLLCTAAAAAAAFAVYSKRLFHALSSASFLRNMFFHLIIKSFTCSIVLIICTAWKPIRGDNSLKGVFVRVLSQKEETELIYCCTIITFVTHEFR